jgi:hypothetical protein
MSLGQSTVPYGFRIVDGPGRVHVTKQIVQRINRETASTNRTDYLRQYIGMLSSGDATNRMFAIYALGQFQSQNSSDALFAHAKLEKNPKAICLLADSLCRLFPYWPGANEGFDSEKWNCEAVLKQWAHYYEQHGYLGLFDAKYAEVKGNLEAEAMFIVGFATDWPSPDLLPFYKSVMEQTSFSKIRNACHEAIDSLSGRN